MGNTYKNDIQKHTYSIPSLVLDQAGPAFARCEQALAGLRGKPFREIRITGCGYSYAAALGVRHHLAHVTGIPVVAEPAMETSRFSSERPNDPEGTLLVAVSNSGAVSRINEAVLRWKALGATVIGLTANEQSPLGKYAHVTLSTASPAIGGSQPLRGYAMTILVLQGIGCALAGRGAEERAALEASMAALEAALPETDRAVMDYLSRQDALTGFEFVGSGYERGPAFLGKIQMLGQAGVMALEEDSEQWCHCNFFLARPEAIGTVLFHAKGSPAASRNREALSYMRHLKRPVLVATDDGTVEEGPGCTVIRLPEITARNAGLVEMVVPSLLTGHYCDRIGEVYSRGFRDQWAMFRDGCGTCESEIVLK